MSKFKKGDEVVKVGTTEPVYTIMGETMNTGNAKDYVKPQIGFWTCYYAPPIGSWHIEEIPENELEFAPPSK